VPSSSSLFPLLLDVSRYLGKDKCGLCAAAMAHVPEALIVATESVHSAIKIPIVQREKHITHLSTSLLLSVVLADVLKFDTSRTRCLAITSCSHSVTVVARPAHSPLDRC
jgi:hypothetical protein